jgi:hypothetical protein
MKPIHPFRLNGGITRSPQAHCEYSQSRMLHSMQDFLRSGPWVAIFSQETNQPRPADSPDEMLMRGSNRLYGRASPQHHCMCASRRVFKCDNIRWNSSVRLAVFATTTPSPPSRSGTTSTAAKAISPCPIWRMRSWWRGRWMVRLGVVRSSWSSSD